MGRTWSTFNTPPQWGKIQGIPSDFADGKIDWGEITNKPTTFTPTPFPFIEFAESGINYLDFHVRDNTPSVDFDARISCFLEPNAIYSNGFGVLGYQAFRHLFYGNFQLMSLPLLPENLATGTIWKDSNGFLRVV